MDGTEWDSSERYFNFRGKDVPGQKSEARKHLDEEYQIIYDQLKHLQFKPNQEGILSSNIYLNIDVGCASEFVDSPFQRCWQSLTLVVIVYLFYR